LTEVAGYYRNLMVGFERLGVRATYVDLSGNPYGYRGSGAGPGWIRLIERLLARVRGKKGIGFSLRKALWGVVRSVFLIPVGLWALVRCDLFVFGFRTSFARHFELPLIRALGKRSVFIFHGSDARPPYLSTRSVSRARQLKSSLRRIERWADVIVAHQPYAHLLERPFIPWLWIGIPYPTPSDQPEPTPLQTRAGAVRVVHAPTSPTVKGSDLIRRAIAQLEKRGLDIDLVELVGRSNAEILKAIRNCDFVVDQTYSDTPMAGLATEAAANGKPSVVGGYDLRSICQAAPIDRLPPSVVCPPSELEATIERLASDHSLRAQTGMKARAFIETQWAPEQVAGRLLRTVTEDLSPEIFQQPHPNPYVHAGGISEDRAIEGIRAVVEAGGLRALQILDSTTIRLLADFADLGKVDSTDSE
jgi:glycosyltransferase involved in cell wall biosynthesis